MFNEKKWEISLELFFLLSHVIIFKLFIPNLFSSMNKKEELLSIIILADMLCRHNLIFSSIEQKKDSLALSQKLQNWLNQRSKIIYWW